MRSTRDSRATRGKSEHDRSGKPSSFLSVTSPIAVPTLNARARRRVRLKFNKIKNKNKRLVKFSPIR